MKQKTIHLGRIVLGSSVYVTDPCYNPSLWCAKLLKNILPGNYACKVVRRNCGIERKPDFRNTSLTVIHEDYLKEKFGKEWKTVAPVDSGQCGVFDAAYYESKSKECELAGREDGWYEQVCGITTDADKCGTVDDMGAVSSSGFGDGAYPVYVVRNNKEEIVGIKIKYVN